MSENVQTLTPAEHRTADRLAAYHAQAEQLRREIHGYTETILARLDRLGKLYPRTINHVD